MMAPIVGDPVLGSMEHDGYYYKGLANIADAEVEFSIGTYRVEDVASRLERARQIRASVRFILRRAKRFAADKLLSLKNDSWEEEDGRKIDGSEFEERLTVESVTLDHDGELVIYFDDNDLFFGHHILVTQGRNGEWDRAEIHG